MGGDDDADSDHLAHSKGKIDHGRNMCRYRNDVRSVFRCVHILGKIGKFG